MSAHVWGAIAPVRPGHRASASGRSFGGRGMVVARLNVGDEPEVTVRATRADRRRQMAITTYTPGQFIRGVHRLTIGPATRERSSACARGFTLSRSTSTYTGRSQFDPEQKTETPVSADVRTV